jgi:hypothetical protein
VAAVLSGIAAYPTRNMDNQSYKSLIQNALSQNGYGVAVLEWQPVKREPITHARLM